MKSQMFWLGAHNTAITDMHANFAFLKERILHAVLQVPNKIHLVSIRLFCLTKEQLMVA